MRKAVFSIIALFASGLFRIASEPTDAAEIKLIGSVGVKSAMDVILPHFERDTGHRITVLYGIAANLKARIDGGESFDVTVLNASQIDDLIKQGKVLTHADVARAVAGFALRANAAKPDISTDEKLKAFLLGVKSISHSDPALGAFGVVYLYKLATAIGIADALKAKTIYNNPGEGAMPVAMGRSEIGVGLSSEVIPVAGVQFLPFRPDDPATYIAFTGAVAVEARDADAARAFLAFVQSPVAKSVFEAQGLMTP